MSQINAEESESSSGSAAASRFVHDFSRVPAHAAAAAQTIQTKLAINAPGDAYEAEADAVAAQVVGTSAPQASDVRRQSEAGKVVRRNTTGDGGAQLAPPVVSEASGSSGQPLDGATRAFMETRFGHDFSRVRVHNDAAAAGSARAIRSRAYTAGNDVVFGAGEYSPQSAAGRRLLAHELAHVVQQRRGQAATPSVQRQPAAPAKEEKEEKEETIDLDPRYYASAKALSDIVSACQNNKLGETNKSGQTKITADSPVNSGTAQMLDDVMERAVLCGSLSRYITLRPQKLSQGHVAVLSHYRGNNFTGNAAARSRFLSDDFNAAVFKYFKGNNWFDKLSPVDQLNEVAKAGGFYDRANDKINLPSTGKFGDAVHESVHRLSGLMFNGLYGHYLNEGVTQYFANRILADESLPPYTGHAYQKNLTDAELLISKVGWELVAQLYFQGTQAAHWEIRVRLGLTASVNDRRHFTEAQVLAAIRAQRTTTPATPAPTIPAPSTPTPTTSTPRASTP
ncbi:MAG TPA: DUF4157 domain-containing protein [Pyrinomonadaceae bacterium]|nr:DUF4157 domain-containing protein [Pyrinomonadaceae bacterium]